MNKITAKIHKHFNTTKFFFTFFIARIYLFAMKYIFKKKLFIMPGWLIVLIVFAVVGGILGVFASFSEDSKDMKPHQGYLSGALLGTIAGGGCLMEFILTMLPIIIGIAIYLWLFG